MPGALLRSGTLKEFRALGVEGQPVYGAALQLRGAIRLKMGRETANCLAIPQPNELGDRVDWYAPTEGDVIPWSAATQEERDSALSQLESVHQQLLSTADGMEADANNREKQLFARLLRKAIHFPSSEHVYLVGGKPVVSFWGFAERDGAETDPLLCLQALPPAPISPVVAAAVPPPMPTATPSVVPVTPVKKRRWWWWLLWLLLLLLLLFLLLFGLRACAPKVVLPLGLGDIDLPGLPAPNIPIPELSAPDFPHIPDRALPGQVAWPDGSSEEVVFPDLGDETLRADDANALLPSMEENGWEDNDADLAMNPEGINPEEEMEPEFSENFAPDSLTEDLAQASVPEQEQGLDEAPLFPPEPANAPDFNPPVPPPPELVIPEQALADSSTDFLNGHWHVGSGVQDTQTGQPLQLDYDFKNGQGQLRIQRDDGVECFAAVGASVQDNNLSIRSRQQTAACSDGGSYNVPELICKQGDTSADCTGHYADDQLGPDSFPVTMRRRQGG